MQVQVFTPGIQEVLRNECYILTESGTHSRNRSSLIFDNVV